MALATSTLFTLIIQLLKIINPFLWFGQAVSAINTTFGEGMTRGGNAPAPLKGLTSFINSWYDVINGMAWQALVPLFIAFTVVALILFTKVDRGSVIKKLIVRIVYIGVGLPLIGSLYTGVLDKFDDSLLAQQSGPTRVVLSTYVDFQSWAMNDRLGIPEAANIAWDNGQASADAMMSVRGSALAINKQTHGTTYAGITDAKRVTDAQTAWREGTTGLDRTAIDDAGAVFTTFGIIGDYIASNEVAASDFESGVKSSITKLRVDTDDKKGWFIGDDGGYGDVDEFGEDAKTTPTEHPVLSVGDKGLTSSNPGGDATTYTTPGVKSGCGFTVWANNAPAACNLSGLSMYNYLNTGFGPSSLTMYSSNNATSGFTRENHMAVSQIGTGPAKFMYWFNAAIVLGSIALLGFWYAIGMLAGAVKRTFSLVAAVPFAALGALAAISKVIVHALALIFEVLVTLFIYQFVSEFLTAIPDIIAGPISNLMSSGGLFGSTVLGGIVVVVLTLVSSLLIIGVTLALLRVRKVALQAMDEVFTKLVDRFLDTNTAPRPGRSGLLPALASGAGAGAGMALGHKLATGLGSKVGGETAQAGTDMPGSSAAPTNAGGTNGDPKALTARAGALVRDVGGHPGEGRPQGPRPYDGGPGGGTLGGAGEPKALPGGSRYGGSPSQLTSGTAGSARSDKNTAQTLHDRGGLTRLGYGSGSVTKTGGAAGGRIDSRPSFPQLGAGPRSNAVESSASAASDSDRGARFIVDASGSAVLDSSRAGGSAASGNPSPAVPTRRPAPRTVPDATERSAASRPDGLVNKRPFGLPRAESRIPPAPRSPQSRPRAELPPAPTPGSRQPSKPGFPHVSAPKQEPEEPNE